MKLSVGAVISGNSISNLDHEGETKMGESQQYKILCMENFSFCWNIVGVIQAIAIILIVVPGEMGTLSIYNYS